MRQTNQYSIKLNGEFEDSTEEVKELQQSEDYHCLNVKEMGSQAGRRTPFLGALP